MKKFFAIMFIGVATTLAADTIGNSEIQFPPNSMIVNQIENDGFFYVRFAVAESDIARASAPVPGLGLGYRRLAGNGAADISISGIGISSDRNSRFFWIAPKTSYFFYSSPDRKESFYYGGGLAWGGLKSKKKDSFVGIIPSLTYGYEFMRKSPVLGFAEFNVSQPALAVYKKGSFPGPVAECTIGFGF